MNIAIRTDASLEIGTGHVMRCLVLAQALKEKGNTASFICRKHQGHLIDRIHKSGFRVFTLPAPKESVKQYKPYASWLGGAWQEDVDQTRIALQQIGRPDWLIVDHYGIDHRWEGAISSEVERIMVIDDLADRNHTCQLLLDQNYLQNMKSRYAGKVPDGCLQLLGPQYALLNPIYAEVRKSVRLRHGPVHRLLIFFGGSDKNDLTGKSFRAFLELNRNDIVVDVVVGQNNPHYDSIKKLSQRNSNIFLHHDLPNLAKVMANADLALGASGSTTWERMCLGLPSLIVSFGEDQKPIARFLHYNGYIHWIGHSDEVIEQNIKQELEIVLSREINKKWSERCRNLVDGCGADRVFIDMKSLTT